MVVGSSPFSLSPSTSTPSLLNTSTSPSSSSSSSSSSPSFVPDKNGKDNDDVQFIPLRNCNRDGRTKPAPTPVIPPPRLLNHEASMNALTTKSKISSCISSCDDSNLKTKFQRLHELLLQFLQGELVRIRSGDPNSCLFEGNRAVQGVAGVYVLSKDNHGTKLKWGTGLDCLKRTKQQLFKKSIQQMDLEMLLQFIQTSSHPNILQTILELYLPGTGHHPSRKQQMEERILLQLGEMVYACTTDCITNTVLERIAWLPTHKVRQIMHRQCFPSTIVATFPQLEDSSVAFQATWPQLLSSLEDLAAKQPTDSFLQRQLRSKKEDCCVTFYMTKQVWGSKLNQIQNALTCPRVDELNCLINKLRPLLQSLRDGEEAKVTRDESKQHEIESNGLWMRFGVKTIRRMCTPPVPTLLVPVVESCQVSVPTHVSK